MPKKDFTVVACILDRSGSMQGLENDVIGGYNTMLREQKLLPGKAKFTLVLFDDKYELVYDLVPLQNVPELTKEVYYTRGFTRLVDACCETIDSLGAQLDAMCEEERPEAVVIIINTDGQENDSQEYSSAQLAEKIKTQQDTYKWKFIFLGANQDAFATANQFHIQKGGTYNFAANSAGIRASYATSSTQIGRARRVSIQNMQELGFQGDILAQDPINQGVDRDTTGDSNEDSSSSCN